MSQENVEIVRAAIDAWNRGDWDAVLKDTAPDFEFDLSRAVGPDHGVYGPEELRGLWAELADTWESVRIEPEEFIEAGDHVVVPVTWHTAGRDGIEVRARPAWTITIRDGTIVRFCMYQELEEALEAAGLQE
jgi:uncharacterized protein